MTRFVLIRQQRTMLGELDGTTSSRIQRLRALFNEAGFSAAITRNMEGWLTAHAAFIVPIAFAPYLVDGDPRRLASDQTSLQLMVQGHPAGVQGLRTSGNAEIPSNPRICISGCPSGSPSAIGESQWPALGASSGSPHMAESRPTRCTPWRSSCSTR